MNSLFACSSAASKYSMLSVSSSGMVSTCVYRNKSIHPEATKEVLRDHVGCRPTTHVVFQNKKLL